MARAWGADPNNFGQYDVEIHGWEDLLDDKTRFKHTIAYVDLLPLAHKLIQGHEILSRRILSDQAAGDCAVCGNLRMVDVRKPGNYTERDYCPRCRPKIDAALAKLDPYRG